MVKCLIVDPPSGWKYGFPKILSRIDDKETVYTINYSSFENVYKDLLKHSKYPEKDFDLAIKYSRYWIEQDSFSNS